MTRIAIFMPIITAKYVKAEFELRFGLSRILLLNAHLRSGRRQMSETSERLLWRG